MSCRDNRGFARYCNTCDALVITTRTPNDPRTVVSPPNYPLQPAAYRKHAAYLAFGDAFCEDQGAYALAVDPGVANQMQALRVGRDHDKQVISCDTWTCFPSKSRSACVMLICRWSCTGKLHKMHTHRLVLGVLCELHAIQIAIHRTAAIPLLSS